MKQEQKAVMATGILVAVVLFLAVYLWFKQDDFSSTSGSMTGGVPSRVADKKSMTTADEPMPAPASAESVTAEIDRQMAAEDEAFDAEVSAETAAVDAEVTSINELSKSYDASEY